MMKSKCFLINNESDTLLLDYLKKTIDILLQHPTNIYHCGVVVEHCGVLLGNHGRENWMFPVPFFLALRYRS